MKNKKIGIIVSLIIVGVLLIFGVQSVISNTNIDKLPEEGLNIDSKTQAYIVNGQELVTEIKSTEAYSSLSKDLFVFGKTAYPSYTEEDVEVVGFKVKKISNDNENLNIEGNFGASDNKVVIQVTLLKKNRINTSVTDVKTGLNIDSFLPSNTVLNGFIGTLPIETSGYVIEYLETSDTFTINVFNSPNNYQLALNKIEESIGAEEFKNLNIIRYGAGDVPFDNGF